MNCAKCQRGSRMPLRVKQSFKLLKIGESDDRRDEQFQCPNCRAKFWFSKAPAEMQITLNRSLTPYAVR